MAINYSIAVAITVQNKPYLVNFLNFQPRNEKDRNEKNQTCPLSVEIN